MISLHVFYRLLLRARCKLARHHDWILAEVFPAAVPPAATFICHRCGKVIRVNEGETILRHR